MAAVRAFFGDRGFLEVDTPVRVAAPAMELHIDAVPAGDGWLRTSPEFHMKRLLAEGWPRVYQIGPCFRAGERGAIHNTEFSMLEWYRAPGAADDVLRDIEALLPAVARAVWGSTVVSRSPHRTDFAAPPLVLTVSEAFSRYAGWDPAAAFDADRFDLDLVNKVEPALPRDRPVVLRDYPASCAAFARLRENRPTVADRFEVYLGGIELANGYSELTDPDEYRRRYDAWSAARRAAGKATYPPDEAFLASLATMPPAGGVALGVDRLAMLLSGADTLDDVLPFREPCD